jgi:hypothetical protein
VATTLYDYGPGVYDLVKLDGEIRAAQPALPGYQSLSGLGGGMGQPSTSVQVIFDAPLLPADKGRLDTIVNAHDGRPRRARPLWAIRADVQALTTGQFSNVWNNLSAPVPGEAPRFYLTDYGVNAGAIFVFDHVIYVVQGTAAQQRAAQLSLTALYVQDNPAYLLHPPFDSSIVIDGTEPVT